jgi:SOS-response transcriptional repressor LexA
MPRLYARKTSRATKTSYTREYPRRMGTKDIIRTNREKLGLTVEEFADLCGVSRGAVQHWERGATAPNRRHAPLVASVLGITVSELAAGDSNISAGPNIGGAVPLLSDVQAGNYKEHVDNFHPGDGGEELVPTSVPVKRHTFALRVAGDSMEPMFTEGMVLIVEPEIEAQPGDYVIAKNSDNGTTFKQLVKDGADWYLKPLNERYPIKPLGKNKIVGVVRAVERRFR